MHLIGYLRCRLVCVVQFYFDASDEGTVYPVFCCGAAGLADNGAQVSFGEAHVLGRSKMVCSRERLLACWSAC